MYRVCILTWIEQMQLASDMHQVKLKCKVFKPELIVLVAKTISAAWPTVLEQIPAVDLFEPRADFVFLVVKICTVRHPAALATFR